MTEMKETENGGYAKQEGCPLVVEGRGRRGNLGFPIYSYLPVVEQSEFSKLYEMLKKIKLPIKEPNTLGRANFTDKHRAATFGKSYQFTKQLIHEKSRMSKRHPHIHDELMRLATVICPNHEFTGIYMNHNNQCDKHKDTSNVGNSVIVSFGEYEGGNLWIDGEECNAKYHPILFDGSKYEHWNLKDLVGTKYSLVFFSHKRIHPKGTKSSL